MGVPTSSRLTPSYTTLQPHIFPLCGYPLIILYLELLLLLLFYEKPNLPQTYTVSVLLTEEGEAPLIMCAPHHKLSCLVVRLLLLHNDPLLEPCRAPVRP